MARGRRATFVYVAGIEGMEEKEEESSRSLLDHCRALRDEVARLIQTSRDMRRRLKKPTSPRTVGEKPKDYDAS